MKHFLSPKLIWLKRAILNGWQSLFRNKLLAVATMLIIALMFYVFNVILAMSFATDSVIDSIGKQIDIRAEINPGVENYRIQSVSNEIEALPEVEEVFFISKEEALNRFGSKYPNVITFLDRHQLGNPLPDVLRIVSQQVEDNEKVIAFLERPQYESIINQQKLKLDLEQKERNEKILGITRFMKNVGFWLNLVFAIVAVLIIFNSININIHTHQNEIHIMKLVGAKHHFIRGGFLAEGVMYALFAFLISLALSRLTLVYISKNLLNVITNESLLVGLNAILVHFEDRFWITFAWQLFAVILVGLISSYLAIELYLRKKHSFS